MLCKIHTPPLTGLLKDRKLKVTTIRLQLLDVLEHENKPLSIALLQDKLPKADKVTLYRSMETLVEHGLVNRVTFKDRQAYFEIYKRHHHHLVCTQCGKVADIEHCTIQIPNSTQMLRKTGFKILTEHSLEFYGICSRCAK